MFRPSLLRALRFIGNAALVLLALATLGAFCPAIPLLGELGPILITSLGPWITAFSLIGTAAVLRRWWIGRGRKTLLVVGLAGFAAIGTLWIQARHIATARENGAQIDIAQAFLSRSQADTSLRPVTVSYTLFAGESLPLDLYRPMKSRGYGPAPVFIYIHGGGWGAQTLRQRQADFRWFSERGYLVISLEYSLSAETRPTWNIAEQQLACGLKWIGGNVDRFGGDPARTAIWGESAGGNLALNVSYRANAGKLESACKGALPRIAATAALYPVVDPERMYHNPDPLIGHFGRTMTTRYTGGTPGQFPDRYRAIASATHITAKAPPTLLIVPEADHLVVPQAAYAFARKARIAGVETQLITMPYAEHSFDLRSGSIGNQMVRQVMQQFLEAHGLKP
jgi:acetyl esterase